MGQHVSIQCPWPHHDGSSGNFGWWHKSVELMGHWVDYSSKMSQIVRLEYLRRPTWWIFYRLIAWNCLYQDWNYLHRVAHGRKIHCLYHQTCVPHMPPTGRCQKEWKCAPADYYITHLTCLGQKFMPKDNICQTFGSTKPAFGWFQKEWDKGGRFKRFVFCSLFWILPFLQSLTKCMVRDISFCWTGAGSLWS